MSQQLISRSADLKRLRDEGYDIDVVASYLVLRDVPYVTGQRQIKRGVLVSTLQVAGDCTTKPDTHVVRFGGEFPCRSDGTPLDAIRHSSGREELAQGLVVDHQFSSKPTDGYPDYYDKMTTYATILDSQAQQIDPKATARTFPVVEIGEDESVFKYLDTASSRAGIAAISAKLEMGKVAIIGLGGTGSYILDLIAKTPVKEIHLYDGDRFISHNAFRSPGAPSVEQLREKASKVAFFANAYAPMRRSVIPHECYLDPANVDELRGFDFVFLAFDGGQSKKQIVERLAELDIPFVDVGMGVYKVDDNLGGTVRVTTSSKEQRGHVAAKSRIPFSDAAIEDEYATNIQVADLNALNATLAVIKWKKLFGFYQDLEREHHSTYMIDGNELTNEDKP